MNNQTENQNQSAAMTCSGSSFGDPSRRRKSSAMMGLLSMTAMMGVAFGMGGGGYSSSAERHCPDREKTPEDLERIAAAQRKRDKKAARRNSHQNTKDQEHTASPASECSEIQTTESKFSKDDLKRWNRLQSINQPTQDKP